MNLGPLDLQSNALPLSYTPVRQSLLMTWCWGRGASAEKVKGGESRRCGRMAFGLSHAPAATPTLVTRPSSQEPGFLYLHSETDTDLRVA